MTRRTLLALPAAALLLSDTAGADRAGPAPDTAPPTIEALPSGLTLIVEPRAARGRLAAQLWVRAGSATDGDTPGAAHLLEHALFLSAGGHGPGGVDEVIENQGGILDASTGRDWTSLRALVPAAGLATALSAFADMFLRAALPAAAVEREKAALYQELDILQAPPLVRAQVAAEAALFPGHPYGPPPWGTPGGIAATEPAALTRLGASHYGPATAALVLVGDITLERARELALSAFPAATAAKPPKVALPVPARSSSQTVAIRESEAILLWAIHAPAASASRLPAFAALAQLLGAPGGRLSTALGSAVERGEERVGSRLLLGRAASLLEVWVETIPERIAPARVALAKTILDLGRDPLPEAELNMAAAWVSAHERAQAETPAGRAWQLGEWWSVGRPLGPAAAPTAGAVQAAARLLTDGHIEVIARPGGD